MIELTDKNFQKEVLEKKGYILVDFYINNCFPCQMITPIIEKLAEEYRGKVIFKKAQLRDISNYCEKYGINSAPTIILFKNGEPISGFVGFREEEEIIKWIEEKIKNPLDF